MSASADPGQIITISGVSLAEGSSGQADHAVFSAGIFGNQVSNTDVSFRFRTTPMHTTTQPGDAVQGSACSGDVDFIGQDRTVIIPAHANPPQVSISVPICGDTVVEPNEAFGGLISDVVNAFCLTDSCGAVSSILDDDTTTSPAPAPLPTNATIADGRATGVIVDDD